MKEISRIIKAVAVILAAAVLAACTEGQDSYKIGTKGQMSITASQETPAGTKTSVQPDRSVIWDIEEEIMVFGNGTSAKFTSDNADPSASAEFYGSDAVRSEDGELWAVYPYDETASFDGSSITTVVSNEQTAKAGTFARNTNLSIAKSESSLLQFYNVGGGVRFTVTEEGITKVIFEGLDGEAIAGTVKVGFGEDGKPEVKEVTDGRMFITLNAPEGESLIPGEWYYIVAIPGTLEKGFKMRFYKGETYGRRISDKEVTLKRSVYGTLEKADSELEYPVQDIPFPETIEEIRESEERALEIHKRTHNLFISHGYDPYDPDKLDVEGLVNDIENLEGVKSVSINDQRNIISVTRKDNTVTKYEMYSGIIDATSSEDNSTSISLSSINTDQIQRSSQFAGKKVLVLSPFQSSYFVTKMIGSDGKWHYVGGDIGLQQMGRFKVNESELRNNLFPGATLDFYSDDEASLEKFAGDYLRNYDFIIVVTHGGSRKEWDQSVMISGTELGDYPESQEALYKLTESYVIVHTEDSMPRYLVSSRWIYRTLHGDFNNSIVFLGSCNSFEQPINKNEMDAVFPDMFVKMSGAGALFGFTGEIPYNNAYGVPSRDLMYPVFKYLNMGLDVNTAYNYVREDHPIWSWWKNKEQFNLLKSDINDKVFFIDPRPTNLKSTVNGNQATLTWTNQENLKNIRYTTYINGEEYPVRQNTPNTNTVGSLSPGDYEWYVEVEIMDGNTVMASYKSSTSKFTIQAGSQIAPVSVSRNSITFQDTAIGSTSAETFTVTNTGSSSLTVSSISLKSGAMFSVDKAGGFTLSAGASQPVTVTFKPAAEACYTDVITITTSAGNTSTVELTGNGFRYQYTIPQAVDLDLPSGTKWAAWNIGASKPEDFGYYYSWGDTSPYVEKDNPYYTGREDYDWGYYKYCSNGSQYGITKYTIADNRTDGIWYDRTGMFIGDNKTVLDLQDDAAHVTWGGNWKMPTIAEFQELQYNCTWEWVEYNGVIGFKVSSKTNSNWIFLPAAGYRGNRYTFQYGNYWSSSLSPRYSSHGQTFFFNSSTAYGSSSVARCYGLPIRPVMK